MRVLIVSDTHGRHSNLIEALDMVQPVDLLVHLGDVEGGEDEIRLLAECPVEIVAGNNDFFSDLPRETSVQIGRYRVLLTHGHYYAVNAGIMGIAEEAAARGYDMVMFGHTHRPVIVEEKGATVINPGSISYPRQEGRKPSFILMETDQKGEAHFELEYL